jgi:hypothetical protein
LERLTIADAAKRLNLTQEAIRQRIRRGTIESDKDEEGKTYVYLTEEETRSNIEDNSVVNAFIDALKSQIEELERDKEHLREESRRKDHIIMSLTQRIPAIDAPQQDAEVAPDARESPVTASEEPVKGDVPTDSVDGQNRQSWWQRWFGG